MPRQATVIATTMLIPKERTKPDVMVSSFLCASTVAMTVMAYARRGCARHESRTFQWQGERQREETCATCG